jgi:putative two-component system response regulator
LAETTEQYDARLQRIMLVEDDAALRGMIARHLRSRGFDVDERGDAEGAATDSLTRGGAYDLLITDLHLPGMSGTELTRMTLTQQPMTPVVVMTGDPAAARESRPFSEGRVTYLLKPFGLEQLDSAILESAARFRLLHAAIAVGQEGEGAWVPSTAYSQIPADWLRAADQQSGAGAGHGDRVSLIAAAIIDAVDEVFPSDVRAAVEQAGAMHELGRVMGISPRPVDLACCTAQLLWEMKVDPKVVRAVRHMHERWDGHGGPDGLVGKEVPATSRILAAADLIDHRASAWIGAGIDTADALERAVVGLAPKAEAMFGPTVAAGLAKAIPNIRWTATLFIRVRPGAGDYDPDAPTA